jgi:antibiotic biosynthesis monooxygenase (ABM) superfamily enzyme
MQHLNLLFATLILCVWLHSEVYSQPQPWLRHTIDSSSTGADGVKMADINGDGLPDIVTGWEEGDRTRLYLNPGKAKVKVSWPAVTIGTTPSVEDAVFADLDGDGKLEVVSCTEKGSEKIYVHWSTSTNLLNPKNWRQEILPASDQRMMWMYAYPYQLDGKNGVDLIADGKDKKAEVGWFEAPANPRDLSQWKWHTMTPAGWIMSIIFRDMDGDGDSDIVITDRQGALRGARWLENPGAGEAQKAQWKSHIMAGAGLEVMFMTMVDMDGDGVEEAVITEKTQQTIRIIQRLDTKGMGWKEIAKISIPDDYGRPKSVEAGDINGDGVMDLVYSTETQGLQKNGLAWLNGKDLQKPKVPFYSISGIHNAKYDKAELIDLDQDGDLDVLICEENYGANSKGLGVIWYENPHR